MAAVLAPRLAYQPMTEADLDTVSAIEARICAFPWTRGNFADSLKSGHSAWVAYEGDLMVGYGVVMMIIDEAHLLNISIVPERQRQGLGSLLLEHFFAVARGYGGTRMLLEVRPSNESGQGLYGRHGFVAIGRRKGYYPAVDGREDAIVMAREL
ncbi:ribosomal-protein-alanine N-acetyltransferase [bacterium]|nr:ribosomal-protein-alanine N-acetyltransferase [bacterium]